MSQTKYTLLLVDDETDMLDFLSYNLKSKEFNVYTCDNGAEAIKIAKQIKPHLVLLDVMMPGMDGIETCEELRRIPELEDVVIAFLTARGEDYSQIAGFEAGGDDYITKPIRPKVLYSRIKALLKRQSRNSSSSDDNTQEENKLIERKGVILDRERYLVYKDNKELVMPKKEFELLSLLISKPDKVFTRDQIFLEVWGENIVVSDRTIDVHIRKLREKIGDDLIKTVKGVGYKFVE